MQVAPFAVDFPDEDDDDWDTSKGLRVLGLAFVPDYSQAAFCCIVDAESDVVDHLRLPHLLKRKNSYNPSEKRNKVNQATFNAIKLLYPLTNLIILGI
jgi:transcription elongation factor SPT6